MLTDKLAVQNVLNKADVLYTEKEVYLAIDDMAATINQRLQNTQPICLCVMVGGLIPSGQLIPRLTMPLEIDYIHATRYRGDTQGNELAWRKYPTLDLKDRTVLIIDDILDEGLTLQAIVEYCEQQGAKSVLTAVLVEKELEKRKGLQQADFIGLTVPDRYVFGFGMDYREQLRHAPGIYAVNGL